MEKPDMTIRMSSASPPKLLAATPSGAMWAIILAVHVKHCKCIARYMPGDENLLNQDTVSTQDQPVGLSMDALSSHTKKLGQGPHAGR
jgi:hypothetical protein